MAGMLILAVLLVAACIIVLSGTPHKTKTREQFLGELADFLEGTLEPMEDESYSNSFRIRFTFSGEDFVYEDVEKTGFKKKLYIAYLKAKTPAKLTLTFTEKVRSTRIRTDIFLASEVSTQHVEKRVALRVPDYLSDLNVSTNDTSAANAFLEDKKIAGILKKFRNKDSRGYPFLSAGIIDGAVILEFSSEKAFSPSRAALAADIPSVEDYLEKLLVVVRRLKSLA